MCGNVIERKAGDFFSPSSFIVSSFPKGVAKRDIVDYFFYLISFSFQDANKKKRKEIQDRIIEKTNELFPSYRYKKREEQWQYLWIGLFFFFADVKKHLFLKDQLKTYAKKEQYMKEEDKYVLINTFFFLFTKKTKEEDFISLSIRIGEGKRLQNYFYKYSFILRNILDEEEKFLAIHKKYIPNATLYYSLWDTFLTEEDKKFTTIYHEYFEWFVTYFSTKKEKIHYKKEIDDYVQTLFSLHPQRNMLKKELTEWIQSIVSRSNS